MFGGFFCLPVNPPSWLPLVLPLPTFSSLPGNFVNYKSFAFGSMLMSLPTARQSAPAHVPHDYHVCVCVCLNVCVYFCITYATFYNSDSYATPPAPDSTVPLETRVVVLLCFILHTHTCVSVCVYAMRFIDHQPNIAVCFAYYTHFCCACFASPWPGNKPMPINSWPTHTCTHTHIAWTVSQCPKYSPLPSPHT